MSNRPPVQAIRRIAAQERGTTILCLPNYESLMTMTIAMYVSHVSRPRHKFTVHDIKWECHFTTRGHVPAEKIKFSRT